MNILIIYASKYGCTADCANKLKNELTGDVTLIDIEKQGQSIMLDKFDTILIGGSVYIGKISKKLRLFCEANISVLTQKNIGLFLCCALTEQSDEFFTTNFPAALLSHAKARSVFGSEARLAQMKFVDKMIIKAVTKGDFSKFKVSDASIAEFIKEVS